MVRKKTSCQAARGGLKDRSLPTKPPRGANRDFRMVGGSQRGAGITVQQWRKVERSLWDQELRCPSRLLDEREQCCFRHKAGLIG